MTAVPLLALIRALQPWLRHVFADGAYACGKFADALAGPAVRLSLAIIKRPDTASSFELLPRRGLEPSFAWLGRNRRLAKDFEASLASARAWLLLAGTKLLMRN